jgi:hypothetical protein
MLRRLSPLSGASLISGVSRFKSVRLADRRRAKLCTTCQIEEIEPAAFRMRPV